MDYLFDDLLILYIKTKFTSYFNEALNRLLNSGFDLESSKEIIDVELRIINFRELYKYDKTIYDLKFWLKPEIVDLFKENKITTIFKVPIVNYLYFTNNAKDYYMSNYTLTLSELAAIFDEAWMIWHVPERFPKSLIQDCHRAAPKENNNSWLIAEMRTRMENLYKKANNISGHKDEYLTKKYFHKFYGMECNILLTKWQIEQ